MRHNDIAGIAYNRQGLPDYTQMQKMRVYTKNIVAADTALPDNRELIFELIQNYLKNADPGEFFGERGYIRDRF